MVKNASYSLGLMYGLKAPPPNPCMVLRVCMDGVSGFGLQVGVDFGSKAWVQVMVVKLKHRVGLCSNNTTVPVSG